MNNHSLLCKIFCCINIKCRNYIGIVMTSMLAFSAVFHCFEPRSCQTKDYKIDNCCLSAKQAVLRNKSKDWLTSESV